MKFASPVEIRVLGPEDAAELREEEEAIPLSQLTERLGRPASELRLYGAFYQNMLGGVSVYARGIGAKQRHKGWICGLYVLPVLRRSGMGRLLATAAVDHARQVEGITVLKLTVPAKNPFAVALYETFGFSIIGREPRAYYFSGRYQDEITMVLPL